MAASRTTCSSKPRVLVLGGNGFIGRNFVEYLITHDLVAKVRAVDKVPPQTAWFSKRHEEVFADPRVEFKSANLINQLSCQNAFNDPDGNYDYVVNLAGETKYGQTDPVYREGILKLAVNCAAEAAKQRVKRYVELSSGNVSHGDKAPMKENDKPDPWTFTARFKMQVEEELRNIPDLNYVVIRPAIVYGVGDKLGLTPRLVVGAVYKNMGEMMKLLWNKDMKMNTVHVSDLSRAIWHLTTRGKNGELYNVVDKGNSTQGKISELVSDLFNINHDYVGNIMSNIAKQTDMAGLVEEINDKHLGPWADACAKDNIVNTPLNPYLDQELLYHKHLYLDGSKLEATGFTFIHPEVTKDALKEVIDDYVSMGLFPHSLVS